MHLPLFLPNAILRLRLLLLSLWIALAVAVHADDLPQATPKTEPMIVRHYDRGLKDARHAYKFELIKAILEITRPEFGDYKVIPFGVEPSFKRQAQLITEGKYINLLWAGPGTVIAQADVIEIPVDILKGLLGYRVCLINPANFPDATTVNSASQLTLAQARSWADLAVYYHNDIHPRVSPTFEGLFDMLAAKRYQCLPLGADEVTYIWRGKKEQYPFLTIEPSLLIYYDYPIYLYVSKKDPALAERVALGIKKMQRNGTFDQLFNQYHAADIAQLQLQKRKVLCLPSPYLPLEHQCENPLVYPTP